MGGELLLVSLGGCFMSNLLEAIRAREAAISQVAVQMTGTLEGTPLRYSEIKMQVSAEHQDRELFEKLVLMSERACIVANTLKPALILTVSIA
jgi:putative redox protein